MSDTRDRELIEALRTEVERLQAYEERLGAEPDAQAKRIAELEASKTRLWEDLKSRIDHRLNEYLCDMKPDYDDSIVGFNEAWEIVRAVFAATQPAQEEREK